MTLILTFISLFLLPTSSMADDVVADYTGEWSYSVVTPDITYEGVMILSMEDGEYTGVIKSQGVNIPLEDVTIEDNELTFSMNVQGIPCEVEGTFTGNKLEGTVNAQGYELPLKARRK